MRATGPIRRINDLFLAALITALPTMGQELRLVAQDGAAGDKFGDSVAIDGVVALVGAPGAAIAGEFEQGAAYVFVRDPATGGWAQRQKLVAPMGSAGDRFGSHVSMDGDFALIGAPGTMVGGVAEQGVAHLFQLDATTGVWLHRSTLQGEPNLIGEGARFGHAVALDGEDALVGAPDQGVTQARQGAVFTFHPDGAGAWTRERILAPDAAALDAFGSSIDVDGDHLLVGAEGADDGSTSAVDTGAAYVFSRDLVTGTWGASAKLTAPDADVEDRFGSAVALDGSSAFVGAAGDDEGGLAHGAAYVFERAAPWAWDLQQKVLGSRAEGNVRIGSSVAAHEGRAVVAAPGSRVGADQDQGAALRLVQDRSNDSWARIARISASAGDEGDLLSAGNGAVALFHDVLLAGAPGTDVAGRVDQGAAYVFEPVLYALTTDQLLRLNRFNGELIDVVGPFSAPAPIEGITQLTYDWVQDKLYSIGAQSVGTGTLARDDYLLEIDADSAETRILGLTWPAANGFVESIAYVGSIGGLVASYSAGGPTDPFSVNYGLLSLVDGSLTPNVTTPQLQDTDHSSWDSNRDLYYSHDPNNGYGWTTVDLVSGVSTTVGAPVPDITVVTFDHSSDAILSIDSTGVVERYVRSGATVVSSEAIGSVPAGFNIRGITVAPWRTDAEEVPAPPVAFLEASTTGACAGDEFVFDATASADGDPLGLEPSIVRYDWDFGDGHVLAHCGPVVGHRFTTPGSYEVTVTVWDNEELPDRDTGSAQLTVDVLGTGHAGCNEPPVAVCRDLTLASGVACQSVVQASQVDAGSFDPDGGPLSLAITPPGPYPVGQTSVTLTVTDDGGQSDACTAVITIVDVAPPEVVVGVPHVLWPPDHVYETIDLSELIDTLEDPCEGPLGVSTAGRLISISSDEPENGTGDGNTFDDIVILSPTSFQVRRERRQNGNGRVYSVRFAALDTAGNATLATARVEVPPDQSGIPAAVDDGVAAGYLVEATASNLMPVANAGPDRWVETGSTVQLDGSASYDLNEDPLSFVWTLNAPVGSLATLSDSSVERPTFVADVGGAYALELVVDDGTTTSAADTLTIEASGNGSPTADPGPDRSAPVGSLVQLDGSSSTDPEGDPLSYSWSLEVPYGSVAVLSDPSAADPTFVLDHHGAYVARLVVSDGQSQSFPGDVRIWSSNTAPVADAGPDRSPLVGATLQLDAFASFDQDCDPLTYSWTLASSPLGSNTEFSEATALAPTLVIDVPGTFLVELVVHDGSVASEIDLLTITTSNSPPMADAGPDQAHIVGTTVQLDGSGSNDVDLDPLTYSWELVGRPAGSSAVLSDPAAVAPTFAIDRGGSYIAQLIVNDGTVDSAIDLMVVTTVNSAPIADAGPDQAHPVGTTVQLDGTGSSDIDHDPLTYAWTLAEVPVGSTAVLSDSTASRPTFSIDRPGTYVAELVVSDGSLSSDPDRVTVTTVNSAPVAVAGADQTPIFGATVQLDGGGSYDVDLDPLTYAWSLTTVPPGSGASLSDPTAATPTYVVDRVGTYVATLVVNDGTLDSAPDTVAAVTVNTAPVADAGADQTARVTDVVQLDGTGSTDPEGAPLGYAWTLSTPPGSTAALSNPGAAAPSFTVDLAGVYTAVLVVDDGALASAPDAMEVTILNSPPLANAGLDQAHPVGTVVQLDGTGSSDPDLDPLTYMWTLSTVPHGSAAILSNPTSSRPVFEIDFAGTYAAELVVSDGQVTSAPDAVVVTTVNSAPVAEAGPDRSVPLNELVQLDGSGSSDPDLDPLTFAWTLATVPAGSSATLSDPSSVAPTFSADLPGTYVAQLVVDDGSATSAPDVVSIATENGRPIADAGPDRQSPVGGTVVLDGSGSSDPEGASLTYAWSLTTVPQGSSATLSDPAAERPTLLLDMPGTFVAQLVVSDGIDQSAPDEVVVTSENSPPIANAGPDRYGDLGSVVVLDGSASSDPDFDPLTYAWSLVATPTGSSASLLDPAAVSTTFPVDVEGDYVAELVVDDGIASTADVVTISIVDDEVPPVVLVTADGSPGVIDAPIAIRVQATDDIDVTSMTLTVDGTPVPLDAAGNGTFTSQVPGVFLAEGIATDPSGNQASDVAEVVVVDPSLSAALTLDVTSPSPDSVLREPTDIVGTASSSAHFLRYTLEYARRGTNRFERFAEGLSPVTNGVLGTLDTTLVPSGLYDIRLTATTLGGAQASLVTQVEVDAGAIVGPFTLAFRDAAFDAGRVPVEVVRSYDSRDETQGDFGVGWRVAVNRITLEESHVAGDHWQMVSGGGIVPTYSLVETRSHTVVIRFGDDDRRAFHAEPSPSSQAGAPLSSGVQMTYLPLAGAPGTLVPDEQSEFVTPVQVGPVQLLTLGGALFDPSGFTYTDVDGTAYHFSARGVSGLSHVLDRVTDSNGVTLNLSPAGITRSDGVSIGFTRDAEGRITRLEAPGGGVTTYEYDLRGDLAAVVDPLGNRTEFSYDAAHDLLEVRDPLGRPLQRQEYDSDGRLVAITGGEGERIELEHDLAANTEIVRDARGNPSIYEYDARGNVVRQTEIADVDGVATAVVVESVYDALDRLVARTGPDGTVTEYAYNSLDQVVLERIDPTGLDLVTEYEYDAAGNLLRVVDPRGGETLHTYDGRNNRVTSTDRENGEASFTYDASGRLTSVTDALANRTEFTYDGVGRMVAEERFDASGTSVRRSTYTYDGAGNELTQTVYVTVGGVLTPRTTTYTYDAKGNRLTEEDPLGNVTRFEWSETGQLLAEIDPLGVRTESVYDASGRRIEVRYADGTSERFTYDGDGNRIETVDREGRATSYTYGASDRATRIEGPDGEVRRLRFDAVGRLIAEIDENGHRVDHEVDAAGRRVRTLQPLVVDGTTGTSLRPETRFEYDENGNSTAVVDAYGRRTEFTYDAEDRRLQTLYPGGEVEARAYDAVGRQVSRTDSGGGTTTYTFDALGRMVAVVQPPPAPGEPTPMTTFTYDEEGNRLTQTDALGRTTRFAYDVGGQRVEYELPGGQTRTWTYDAAGRVDEAGDLSGRATTFGYDTDGRTTLTSFVGGSITRAYSPTGALLSVTDARGTTSYTYDAMGRTSSEAQPGGSILVYTYTPSGRRASVATPGGTTTYTYDALDRLASATHPGGGTTAYAYDAVGNLARVTFANGVTAEFTYDARNRLTSLRHETPGGALLAAFDYTLDARGFRTRVVESGGGAVDYLYDDLGRLLEEARTGPSSFTHRFEYDLVGNRTRADRDGAMTAYVYDANDRLTAATGAAAATYAYDGNGNLASRTDVGGTTSYVHDPLDRLVEVTDVGGATTAYTYDAAGHLVERTGPGGTRRFLVDALNPTGVAQVLEERDGAGALLAHYTYGLDLLSQSRGGTRSFYHYDGLGSTRWLSDDTGAPTDGYVYDAYGRLASSSGSTVNAYLFAGEALDPGTGHYYLRARYYDPETGRFDGLDPFEGDPSSPVSLHRYLYANANPVNFVDPTGRISLATLTVSTGIQTSIRTQYTKHLANVFVDTLEVVYCTLAPGRELQRIGQTMLLQGDPKGYEYYVEGQQLVRRGLAGISATLGDAYLAKLKGTLKKIEERLAGAAERMKELEAGGVGPLLGSLAGSPTESLQEAIAQAEAIEKNMGEALQLFDSEASDCVRMKRLSKFVLKPFISALGNRQFAKEFGKEVRDVLSSAD